MHLDKQSRAILSALSKQDSMTTAQCIEVLGDSLTYAEVMLYLDTMGLVDLVTRDGASTSKVTMRGKVVLQEHKRDRIKDCIHWAVSVAALIIALGAWLWPRG